MRPLLSITFPQGFWISKNIRHPTSGNGGKKTFKRYLKSDHTDTQTDGRTDGPFDLKKASAQRADALKKVYFMEFNSIMVILDPTRIGRAMYNFTCKTSYIGQLSTASEVFYDLYVLRFKFFLNIISLAHC